MLDRRDSFASNRSDKGQVQWLESAGIGLVRGHGRITGPKQISVTAYGDCEYPPLRTADIHKVTSRKQGNVNVLMGRLADQGVVYRLQKGPYEYTAPNFHEYLIRRKSRSMWT